MPKINWIQPKYYSLTIPFICLAAWMAFVPVYATEAPPNQESSSAIKLDGPEVRSREGYFNFTISGVENGSQRFVLERSSEDSFAQVTQYPLLGDARTITLSGFANGDYFFRARVRGDNSSFQGYSNIVKVTVQHYPIWQAATLFGAGALLLVWLLAWMFLSHRQLRRSA